MEIDHLHDKDCAGNNLRAKVFVIEVLIISIKISSVTKRVC